jgi:hypothetical protein
MRMMMGKIKNVHVLILSFLMLLLALSCATKVVQESKRAEPLLLNNNTRPFVVCYSRTGKARMVATALKNQLNCEMGEILSNSKKGISTIMADQIFNRDDDQQPFPTNLKEYSPVVIVSPIWFMRLSSPARTFIKISDLKGKDVYVFTTSGGPLPGGRKKAIEKFGAKYDLNVKGVYSLQIGKKTQADFDKEIQDILKKEPSQQETISQQ